MSFIESINQNAKFALFILLIIGAFNIAKNIVLKVIHLFKMKFNAKYKKEYYKQLIKEAEHQHKKYKLEEAERYRKEKWKDPYNP